MIGTAELNSSYGRRPPSKIRPLTDPCSDKPSNSLERKSELCVEATLDVIVLKHAQRHDMATTLWLTIHCPLRGHEIAAAISKARERGRKGPAKRLVRIDAMREPDTRAIDVSHIQRALPIAFRWGALYAMLLPTQEGDAVGGNCRNLPIEKRCLFGPQRAFVPGCLEHTNPHVGKSKRITTLVTKCHSSNDVPFSIYAISSSISR